MEPMNLGSPGSPDTNLYLPAFLMDEPQTPTTPRSNTLSRNTAVSRYLPVGFTNSPGGVASATPYCSTRPPLGQKTLFGGYQQTSTWGQNASNASPLYLPSFLMDEPQSPTALRSNTLSRNKAVGRDLSFGFTNSPGGVASAIPNCSTRPPLRQKTLFEGYQQTPAWGQNASKYVGTPAQNFNTCITGPPVQGLFDSLRNETNQVQTPLRTQQSNTPPFDRSYVGQRNINFALNQGKQQQQLVNLTGPLHDPLSSNDPSQALQCEAQTPYKGFWVTVYGFPSTAISTILQHFSQCGTIMDKVMPSQNGNWMHLKYSSRLERDKALNYNEKILANNIMIAVTRCKDKDLLDKENVSDNSMESAKARPLSQPGYKDTQIYSSGPNYTCGIQSSAGLVDKFLDFFFGW